jgi:hypothetical protein
MCVVPEVPRIQQHPGCVVDNHSGEDAMQIRAEQGTWHMQTPIT